VVMMIVVTIPLPLLLYPHLDLHHPHQPPSPQLDTPSPCHASLTITIAMHHHHHHALERVVSPGGGLNFTRELCGLSSMLTRSPSSSPTLPSPSYLSCSRRKCFLVDESCCHMVMVGCLWWWEGWRVVVSILCFPP